MKKKIIIKKVKEKKCYWCNHIIKKFTPPTYDPIYNKPVCMTCCTFFFYDCEFKAWFFSKDFGVYNTKRIILERFRNDGVPTSHRFYGEDSELNSGYKKKLI